MDSSYSYNYSSNDVSPEAAAGMVAFIGGFILVMFLVLIACYVFYAICLQKIAKKTKTENGWLAWIPIANIVLMLQIAKKPIWWIILFFIPLANLVITILVWMGIASAVKKPDWLGILMIVPVANLVIPAYLAFSKDDAPVQVEK